MLCYPNNCTVSYTFKWIACRRWWTNNGKQDREKYVGNKWWGGLNFSFHKEASKSFFHINHDFHFQNFCLPVNFNLFSSTSIQFFSLVLRHFSVPKNPPHCTLFLCFIFEKPSRVSSLSELINNSNDVATLIWDEMENKWKARKIWRGIGGDGGRRNEFLIRNF